MILNRLLLKNFWLALVFCFSGNTAYAASTSELTSIIKQLGFHPLNARSSPFTLPNLQGQNASLADYKGNWVFLVFWATWCQACKTEMPVLESVHVAFEDTRLKIVGISIDEGTAAQIQSYSKQHDLTFDILHDQKGQIANEYQATSIPTTYLLTPNQRLAGIARGAVRWDTAAMLGLVEKLITFETLPATNQDVGLTLPQNLVPPTLELVLPHSGLQTGSPQTLDIAIKWHGNPQQFIIKVPELTLPDNVILGNISSSTHSDQGRSQITYHYPLTFPEAGKFLIGPMELAYAHRQGGRDQYTRLSATEYHVAPSGMPLKYQLAIGFAIFLGLGLGGFIAWRKSGSQLDAEVESSLNPTAVDEEYRNLRKQRMTGEIKSYSIGIVELAHKLGPAATEEQELLEKVKFGGLALNSTELKVFERKIEKYCHPQQIDNEEIP